MPQTQYNLHLKGYVGGYDFDRSTVDRELARYFDYEAFGRELFMYDYSMGANNNVFRNV